MVRKRRIWFPGAKFHITSRGVRKKDLFHDAEDRQFYLELLAETKQRFPFELHTYCLMSNHIHLQLETINTPTGSIMQYLHSKYAKFFNKKYEYVGHVFETRYDARWINSAAYELEASKYIHLNPLEAHMVKRLEDYPWSSYRAYIQNEKNPLITKKQIYSYFSDPPHKEYERYVKSGFCEPVFDQHGKFIQVHPQPQHS